MENDINCNQICSKKTQRNSIITPQRSLTPPPQKKPRCGLKPHRDVLYTIFPTHEEWSGEKVIINFIGLDYSYLLE